MTSRFRPLGIGATWLLLAGCSGSETSAGRSPGGGSGAGGTTIVGSGDGGAASDGGKTNHEAGGGSGLGGTSGDGGSPNSGGAPGNGGATSTGGAPSAGGSASDGGSSIDGGATAAGGASATGGTSGNGGTTSSGGSGGAVSSGGSPSTGGSSGTGGSSSSGGSSSTGGAPGAGGAVNTGGSGTGGAVGVDGGTSCAPEDCPVSPNACLVATCSASNACGFSPRPSGTPCASGAGVCDGAGQCNVCTPGTKLCNGNVLLYCNTGGTYDSFPCSGATPYCDAASPKCVECYSASQCSAPSSPCLSATCTANLCTSQNVQDGTQCSVAAGSGTCAAGTCHVTGPACESVTVPAGTDLAGPTVQTSNACLETWAQAIGVDKQTGDAVILSLGPSVAKATFAVTCSPGGISVQYPPSTTFFTAWTACGDKQWHHYAVCFSGMNANLYFDGNAVGKVTVASPPGAAALHLGSSPSSSTAATVIDEFRMSAGIRYSGAFTPDKRPTADASTVLLYHFDEGAGGVSANAVPGWPDLTLPDTVAWTAGCP